MYWSRARLTTKVRHKNKTSKLFLGVVCRTCTCIWQKSTCFSSMMRKYKASRDINSRGKQIDKNTLKNSSSLCCSRRFINSPRPWWCVRKKWRPIEGFIWELVHSRLYICTYQYTIVNLLVMSRGHLSGDNRGVVIFTTRPAWIQQIESKNIWVVSG